MSRTTVARVIQAAVAVALMILLWRLADGEAALGSLASADPLWLVAALGALTAQTVLSALRWRLTAGQLGIALGRRQALAEYYLSQIVNQAIPGGVLGDAGRAIRARRQAGLMASGQAVLFERLAGQLALLVLFATAAAATMARPGGFDWPVWLWPPVAGLLAGVAAGGMMLWLAGPRLPGRAGPAMARFGRAFLRAVWAREVRLRQTVMSFGTALANIAAFACCAAAVGVSLPPATALVLVPLILFTMLVPLTISGWGLREGAAAALLPLMGATAAAGLAASVAFGLAVLVSTLPGLAALAVAGRTGPVQP